MNTARGITVIELIIVLGIGAIILALSFPALRLTRVLLQKRSEATLKDEPIWTARELIHSTLISSASIKDLKTVSLLTPNDLQSTYPKLGSNGGALHVVIPEPGALLRRVTRGRYRSIGWLNPADIQYWIALSPSSVSRCEGGTDSDGNEYYSLNSSCGDNIGLIGVRDEVIFYTAKSGHLRRYSPLTGENQPLTSIPVSLNYSVHSSSSKFTVGTLELVGEERSLALPVAFRTNSLDILELFS